MATKGKAQAGASTGASTTTQAGTQPAICVHCGKKITKGATIKAGCGSRCAAMAQLKTPAQWQAHYKRLSVATIPPNFITVGVLDKVVKNAKHKVAGLTITRMVNAFGKDKASNPPLHPIAQVYYLPNKHRVVHNWLQTPAGLQAMATGNFDKAPKAPKVVTI